AGRSPVQSDRLPAASRSATSSNVTDAGPSRAAVRPAPWLRCAVESPFNVSRRRKGGMGSWSGEVAVVGAYESPRRKAPGVHPFEIQAECVLGALEDAGISLGEVDGLCSSASSPGEGAGWMDVCEVAEYLGVEPSFVDGTDTGGAAPIAQAGHAATAIAAGMADVVVVSYGACSYSGGGDFDTLPSTWGPWG